MLEYDMLAETIGARRQPNAGTVKLNRARMTDAQIAALIRGGSIGELERQASVTDWTTFWLRFAKIKPHGASLDAGVAELRRLIVARFRAGEIELP